MIPLPVACARLGLSWAQGYNKILRGELEGELRGSRWFISVESVERAGRERSSRPQPVT
jgi:hypothetical protein